MAKKKENIKLFCTIRFSCPEWQAGPWSACSKKCGDAFQYRSVTCRSAKEGEEGKLLAAEACDIKTMETQRNCNLGPCQGIDFVTTEWKLVRNKEKKIPHIFNFLFSFL